MAVQIDIFLGSKIQFDEFTILGWRPLSAVSLPFEASPFRTNLPGIFDPAGHERRTLSGTVTADGSAGENDVAVGDKVAQGDTIGVLGQTGNAAGQPADEAHVHFEVKIGGSLVDPAVFLNSVVATPLTLTPYLP